MTTFDNLRKEFKCSGAAISVEGITKKFGKVHALDELSFEVNPGAVFALLGPNGSGKTTIVRILTTLLKPDSGIARVAGLDVTKEAESVRSIIGLSGQYPAVDENLTGKENLEMIGRLYHLKKKKARTRSIELLEIFELTDASDRRVKTYSGGMRRRLDLAAALTANSPIVFLDEPTTGLDPRSRMSLWEIISQHVEDCNTVFLTTQYLEEADRLANKIAIMEKGKVIREGTPQQLKDCCGGDTQVRIKIADRIRTQEAVEALRILDSKNIYGIPETGEISLAAIGSGSILADVVRHLDASGIVMAELGLKQPTLDDVFLAITGHTAEENKEVNNQDVT
jgi:ABC-2 type transport system ATP-binding protein